MAPIKSQLEMGGLSTFSLSVPVAMGYIPLGAVFGFLFMQAGADWWMPLFASLWLYAGAAQFMMIPLMVGGASLTTIALATLAINFRHVFYGLSLLHKRPHGVWARAYQSFSLTDETYAVVTTMPRDTPAQRLVWIGGLNHAWWVLGTLLGTVLGSAARVQFVGLDFALLALFAVLLVEQLRHQGRWHSVLIGLALYGVLHLWVPEQALVLSMAAAVGLAVVLPAPAHDRTQNEPAPQSSGEQA